MFEDTGVGVRRNEALEEVYRSHAAPLWRALVLHTRDRECAADAVAEAFAQLLKRGDEVRDPVKWVWKTAFLLADRTATEERARNTNPEIDEVPEERYRDDLLDLLAALGRLSDRQRASIVLHHYVGFSLREIADIIGSTPAAVGVHLFRGRERLRKELGVRDG